MITQVGVDGFGPYVRNALREFGVDDRFVGTDPELRTPVVFCELHPPDHFPLLFYRQPTAPDIRLRLEELDLDAIQRARIFWTTGTGLSDEPSRTATLGALEARGRRGITVHDLDFRRSLWPEPDTAGGVPALRPQACHGRHREPRGGRGGRWRCRPGDRRHAGSSTSGPSWPS